MRSRAINWAHCHLTMDDGRSLIQMMAGFPRDTSPVSETSGCGPIFWLLRSGLEEAEGVC